MSENFLSLAGCWWTTMYAISSSAEVLLIKELNYKYQVNLPMLIVLCLNCYFPLQAVHMLLLGSKPLQWSKDLRNAYLMLGIIQTVVTTSRSFAVNNLPVPVYVIISNLSIVWNFLLSKFLLKSEFTTYHYCAMICTIGAAVAASYYRSRERDDESQLPNVAGNTTNPTCDPSCDFSAPNFTWGIVSCVAYSFFTAATSVLASRVLKRVGADKKSRRVVSELSFANSFVPAMICLPFVLILKYFPIWEETWDHVEDLDSEVSVVAILTTLAVSKMVDRISKFELIHVNSAFYYQILNAAISGSQAIIGIWVFHDKLTLDVVVALVLLSIALGCTIAGDRAVEAQSAVDKKNPEDPAVQLVELTSEQIVNELYMEHDEKSTWVPSSPRNSLSESDIVAHGKSAVL